MTQQPQDVSDLEMFGRVETERYFLALQGCPLIQERGFEPFMVHCKPPMGAILCYSQQQCCCAYSTGILHVPQRLYN